MLDSTGRAGRLVLLSALLLTGLLIAGCNDNDANESNDGINVSEVWSRPVALTGSDDVGAVFMSIENDSETDDRLIAAEVDIAPMTEIHNTTMDDGVMRMRPVEEIEIPAGETVMLEPGSYHLMMIGLEEALEVGDEFEVRLTFAEHGEMTVTSEVREP